jgi:acetyl esterase/lipase
MSIPEAEEEAAFRLAPVEADATAPYGAHPDQVVDFYRPGGPGGRPAPLVALFHGGAWRARYDRVHLSPLAAHIAGHGLAVASVEYRRGGRGELSAGRWPETLDDVAAALDALPALALRTLGADTVDPRRLVLSGHSAGGHLALWAAARHVLPADSPWHLAAPPRVRGVVALAPYADPAALLPTGIATTLVHGTLDPEVPPQVSASFARAAARSGEELTTTWLPATAHFALITPGTPAAATAVAELTQLAW